MDSPLPHRVEEIFIEALDVEIEEREAYLEWACKGDRQLLAEVRALLASFARSAEYFKQLPERLGAAHLLSEGAASSSPEDRRCPVGEAGQRFGQYTLTELIGSGGMGSVWRAVRSDGRFEGEVAVKLLSRTAGMAGLERFALEGRYLAKLTHPSIARLIDAGVDASDQPYLVLEYVKGLPIDQYCDERALSVEQRIQLFVQVLDALAHAHAHLIVHRDIKPSNVQVTLDGSVKLLDFGIATLLGNELHESEGELTRQLGVALTPEFAAPEQLEGKVVTTSTDVYSAGLLLWLLVVGISPRNTRNVRSLAELRILASKDPKRLLDTVDSAESLDRLASLAARRGSSSADLLKALRSDLDSIVRKAVAVDPEDRYTSVADFAQDLRRYLNDEPVSSQVHTMGYRVRKFVRRHSGSVLTGALALFAIISAAGIALWQGVEARRQRDAAVYMQQRVQASNQFMNLLMNEIGPEGKPLTMAELLDRGVSMLDKQYGTEPQFLGYMWYELATGYFSLGRTDKLIELLSRSEQVARAHNDADLLATTLCARARVQLRGEPERSQQQIQEARSLLNKLATPSIDSTVSCARAYAQVLELQGKRDEAIQTLQATLQSLEGSAVASLQDRLYVMNELARFHFNARNLERTLEISDAILERMEDAGLGASAGYFVNAINRTVLLQSAGEVKQAFEMQRDLLARSGELASARSPLGLTASYGSSLLRLARYEEALAVFEDQLEFAQSNGDAFMQAQSEMHIGRILVRMGRFAEAEAFLARAEAEFQKAPASNARMLDALNLFRAQSMMGRGEIAGAQSLIDAALRRLKYPQDMRAPGLPIVLRAATQLALQTGDAAAAERYATDFHEIATRAARSPERSADVGQALVFRAQARRVLGNEGGVRADLANAITSLTNGFGEDHPETVEARQLYESI